MKVLKYITIPLFYSLAFVSCSSDNDSNPETNNGIIATWSLEKTLSGDNEEPEDCITSYQIKFNDDRNEDNYGSYTSFDDYDCDGTFDNEYEGSYIYEDGTSTLTINHSTGYHDYFIETMTDDELIIYDAF